MKRILPLLLAVACTTEPEKTPSTPAEPDPVPPVDLGPADPLPSAPPEDPSVDTESLGDADTRPAPEATHRSIKRMSVAQASAAMTELSGGIVWVDGSSTYWDTYADTLGVADYDTILENNLDPNVMFQKFLDDAAAYTCDQWVASDAELDDARFFSAAEPDATDPASVTANIQALRILIHGRENLPDDPIIEAYREVFDTVLRRSDDPITAWTTVCVGFFTHPHFFTY